MNDTCIQQTSLDEKLLKMLLVVLLLLLLLLVLLLPLVLLELALADDDCDEEDEELYDANEPAESNNELPTERLVQSLFVEQ